MHPIRSTATVLACLAAPALLVTGCGGSTDPGVAKLGTTAASSTSTAAGSKAPGGVAPGGASASSGGTNQGGEQHSEAAIAAPGGPEAQKKMVVVRAVHPQPWGSRLPRTERRQAADQGQLQERPQPRLATVPVGDESLPFAGARAQDKPPADGRNAGPGAEVLRMHALARGAQLPRPQIRRRRREDVAPCRPGRHQPSIATIPGGTESVPGRSARPQGRSGGGSGWPCRSIDERRGAPRSRAPQSARGGGAGAGGGRRAGDRHKPVWRPGESHRQCRRQRQRRSH